MNTICVVVIARDSGHRQSLAFALEAAGCQVDSHACMEGAAASTFVTAALCAVIDEDCVTHFTSEADGIAWAWKSLLDLALPIILLTGSSVHPAAGDAAITLQKPLSGSMLIDALNRVREADINLH